MLLFISTTVKERHNKYTKAHDAVQPVCTSKSPTCKHAAELRYFPWSTIQLETETFTALCS